MIMSPKEVNLSFSIRKIKIEVIKALEKMPPIRMFENLLPAPITASITAGVNPFTHIESMR